MSQPIRRLFNSVNRLFDRRAISWELLHRQLYGFWEQERRGKPDLPFRFQDTDTALADFMRH